MSSPVTTTAPDDAFYILKAVLSRLLTTGSVTCVRLTMEQYKDIMDKDYIGVYRKKLDEVYRNPMGPGGQRSDKLERENRVAFIVSP
jgi:conserved oligomeric Golgi complex subunit 4